MAKKGKTRINSPWNFKEVNFHHEGHEGHEGEKDENFRNGFVFFVPFVVALIHINGNETKTV